MAIETVEDAQHELQVACAETLADMGDDAPDEGSAMMDLFSSMCYDWPARVSAEVARREFGYVPMGAPREVAEAFDSMFPDFDWGL